MIPEKTGDLRVFFNFIEFYHFHLTQHFLMKTLNVSLPQLSASGWAVSIVLKDTYLHFSVFPEFRRFLGFQFFVHDFSKSTRFCLTASRTRLGFLQG